MREQPNTFRLPWIGDYLSGGMFTPAISDTGAPDFLFEDDVLFLFEDGEQYEFEN